jgi:hypothetical protein
MNTDPSHDEISRHAYSLWEQRGRPDGRDTDIWLDAERELGRPAASTRSASTNSASPIEKARKAQRRLVAEDTRHRPPTEIRSHAPAPETRGPVHAPRDTSGS